MSSVRQCNRERKPSINTSAKLLALSHLLVLISAVLPVQAQNKEAPPFPFTCAVQPDARLTAKLHNTKGFVGGDSAYSVEIAKGRQVWLFGDSFIGEIKDGKRTHCRMVRNCVAIDDPTKPAQPATFSFRRGDFIPGFTESGQVYYWPGDGIMLDGKLYLLFHMVRTKLELTPPFQFEVSDTHLFVIQNPQNPPLKWKWQMVRLPYKGKLMLLGCALYRQGDYVYFFNSNSGFAFGINKNPTVLSRIKISDLETFQFQRMRWWCGHWGAKEDVPETLIEDGASEMTVTEIPGRKGLFAFYIPADKSALMVRHADRPEGPWSERQAVYSFKGQDKELFYYSAKAHRAYSTQDGTIKLTYNCNAKSFRRLLEDASIYFPQALTLKVSQPKTSQAAISQPKAKTK